VPPVIVIVRSPFLLLAFTFVPLRLSTRNVSVAGSHVASVKTGSTLTYSANLTKKPYKARHVCWHWEVANAEGATFVDHNRPLFKDVELRYEPRPRSTKTVREVSSKSFA
jgi:hypothetical protein